MKKFALALLLGLVAGVTQADLMLFWTSGNEYSIGEDRYDNAAYATLYVETSNGFKALDSIETGNYVDTNITGYEDKATQYMLRLFNSKGEAIAESNPAAYSTIIASGNTWYTDTMGMKADAAAVLNSNMTFQAVPEPTSGLLMLLGLAGLALKRKRV